MDVAVIGAGVSGLAAAYELRQRNRSFLAFERSSRAGGVVQTEHTGEFVLDAGPDALLVQKPAALALCRELGMTDRLVPTKVPRTAYVLRHGVLHPLPPASILGFPTRVRPLLASRLFSLGAKLRMAAEIAIPRKREPGDESIAEFVRRRFGSEAVDAIAEPLLAGIHAGDVDRLSMRALFPRLVDAEAKSGSVVRAFRAHRGGSESADGVFRSFPNGIAELVDGLVKAVTPECVRLDSPVTRIERHQNGYVVHVGGAPAAVARSVILAVPAFVAADLLQPIDDVLARQCEAIPYLDSATVAFAFPRENIGHDLAGTGFVVPRTEGISITAGAWITSKWPHRAPEGYALLRAFLGGARDPNVLAKSDAELTQMALRDLTNILSIRGEPTLTRVYRWKKASPQQNVGHGDLMARIDARLAGHPGVFVSAAGFRGVGIPDCIGDARATAVLAARFVESNV
jgi:oxygen-dependent protoporphyrinogen oxidase